MPAHADLGSTLYRSDGVLMREEIADGCDATPMCNGCLAQLVAAVVYIDRKARE